MADHSDRLIYGWGYHVLFDRQIDKSRDAVVAMVPEGSSVLDIASGTGDLAFALRREKRCRVVGVDLSPRMLAFAARRNRFADVRFIEQDATDLSRFGAGEFDVATIVLMLHELPRAMRPRVVAEALRVAGKVIVVDWIAPMPRSLEALVVRVIEWSGRHHYQHFKDYLASGGIDGALGDLGVPFTVAHRAGLGKTCRQINVLVPNSGP